LNQPSNEAFEVVDLQALGLDGLNRRGNLLEIGATVTLQNLLNATGLQPALGKAIGLEATYNLRQIATVAGTLASADGRSPFVTAMLALDASLHVQSANGSEEVSLGDFLPVRLKTLHGKLITRIEIPAHVRLAYESVARSPADLPIVCVAVARWSSGRTRVAVGGYGPIPLLAMDGSEAGGAEAAAANAYSQAGDEWATADYRREMASILTRRCLAALE
jgi:CO/xanthine dehydrogenase FAD-binding subunit